MSIATIPSLFDGIDATVNSYFGVPSYQKVSALTRLPGRTDPEELAGLVHGIHERIAENLSRALISPSRRVSLETWRRGRPQLALAAHNDSPEVMLERRFLQACVACRRPDWTNQVPVISGLFGSRSGRRCAIDLVHERGPSAFDFIELKVGSDTPLYAAIEILQYGFAWLLSRSHKETLQRGAGTLLDGDDVRLSVLAPAAFYGTLKVQELQQGLDLGLGRVSAAHGATMTFRFEAFPATFEWPKDYRDAELCAFFDERQLR